MGEVSAVRKTFEDSLRKIDELIEGLRVELDRIKAEFERCLELFPFDQSDLLFMLGLIIRDSFRERDNERSSVI